MNTDPTVPAPSLRAADFYDKLSPQHRSAPSQVRHCAHAARLPHRPAGAASACVRQSGPARHARPPDHTGRIQRAYRARATCHGRSQIAGSRLHFHSAAKIRRAFFCTRNFSLLLHRRALGTERATARPGNSSRGRANHGCARIRRGPHARAAQDSARSSRLAGRRKPHQTRRTSSGRSRDSLWTHRHRRNRRLHLLRSPSPRRAWIRFRLRRPRDDRVPRAQIAARIGIDAARVRRDVRCVPRRLCITKGRNVARRNRPLD